MSIRAHRSPGKTEVVGFGPALTLRQRAIAALARREHSRSELARKLAPHAESADELASLLDELERARLLSNTRFADSLVRRRMERYGRLRIAQELGQHGLAPELVSGKLADLKDSECARCKAVWARRYSAPPADLAERARQTRFLAARGFDNHVINMVLKAAAHPEPE